MNTRNLVFLTVLLGCTLAAKLSGAQRAEQNRPNIVLIMADDLGYGELGCYGQEKIETPNIDRLAADGMRFTQFYTGAPVCAPARCILMTGKHGGHAQVRSNAEIGSWDSFRGQLPLNADEITIAESLKHAGYATAAFGKWGLGEVGSSGDPLNQGFDRFFGYNCQRHAHNYYPRYLISDTEHVTLEGNDRGVTGEHYAPQLIADEMLNFVRKHHEEPFFVYYPSVIPHLALQVPEEDIAHYRGRWEETPYTGNSYQPHPTPRAAYAAMITFLDTQIGRLMHLLEELGVADNTLIIFTSDNGPTHLKTQVDYEFFNSAGGLSGLKGSVLEGGIRVPMIAHWPGHIEAGSTNDHIGAHYDIINTLCDAVGVVAPAASDGISILPTLLGNIDAQREHDYLFWDFAGYGGQLAVRMGNWKAVKRNMHNDPDAPLQLYNLEVDPTESTDVAGDHPDIAARLEAIMREARTRPAYEGFCFGTYSDDSE